MPRLPVHQPPPDPVVADLIRAGLTRSTAMAMETWKAREVLDLLHEPDRAELRFGSVAGVRGSI